MPWFIRDDGARLEYEIRPGAGSRGAFVFQHGMGGDRRQPLGYVRAPLDLDLVAMDARGHGDSSDVVGIGRCSFDAYADDVIALADHLGLGRIVLGGISLGAAVALNAAIRHPDRIAALVLCRPAWSETPQASLNRDAYTQIADLLDGCSTDEALDAFVAGPIHGEVESRSADAAQSLRHQIIRPRAAVNAEVLRRFPVSSPAPDPAAWSAIAVPTLVIGHRDDPFHPWPIAQATAARIDGARLVEVTSKDRDPGRFAVQIDAAIHDFLHGVGIE